MKESALASQKHFLGKIDRSDSIQHLHSHRLFILELQQFLEPFDFPFFADKFLYLLRFYCRAIAGVKSRLEELEIDFQPPDLFNLKLTVSNSKNSTTKKYVVAIADIIDKAIATDPFLKTTRLQIGLLLPSEEPAIIDFLQQAKVWQMRGERYTPIANVHSCYQPNNIQPWFKYYFVLRLLPSNQPVGFISFIQISQPKLITPLISPISYEPVMLSYGLSPSYWGQELMSEALSACVPWFTRDRDIKELIAFAQIKNRGSRRILQKLGLEEYGVLKDPQISRDLKHTYKFMIYKKILVKK